MNLSVSMTLRQTILGWILIFLHQIALPFLFAFIGLFLPIGLTDVGLNIAVFISVFILATLIFRKFLEANFQVVKAEPVKCLLTGLAGFGIYYGASIVLAIFINAIDPNFANINDAALADMSQNNYWTMFLCVVFFVPISEECMYRGLLFQGLYSKNRILAYIVSMLAFSAIHVVGYIGTAEPLNLFLCLLQYLPAGFSLAWAYEKADTIWAPIFAHMIVNLIGMCAMR